MVHTQVFLTHLLHRLENWKARYGARISLSPCVDKCIEEYSGILLLPLLGDRCKSQLLEGGLLCLQAHSGRRCPLQAKSLKYTILDFSTGKMKSSLMLDHEGADRISPFGLGCQKTQLNFVLRSCNA